MRFAKKWTRSISDVDVYLSPHMNTANTALSPKILYYTTSVIKQSVRSVTDELILIPISGEVEAVRQNPP
ncbi:hypothetical protein PsorP6_013030 [Peronosclerospora sorghi]|uniref:Uncharacterized protein n=1 Tax=Peronosclerospora sorghi TaxID=230839 RepID=A0ACC0WHG4_9STRA|nr:hypothetical protein PsorP6_013030 [Peronosclerospora sorghi]